MKCLVGFSIDLLLFVHLVGDKNGSSREKNDKNENNEMIKHTHTHARKEIE